MGFQKGSGLKVPVKMAKVVMVLRFQDRWSRLPAGEDMCRRNEKRGVGAYNEQTQIDLH